MTCEARDGVVLCGPPQGVVRRMIRHCPTDERRTRFVVRWLGAWYGQSITCVACGDSWMDGERAERPFKRGWREEQKARARRDWTAALSPAQYEAFIAEDCRAAVAS